MPRAAAIGTLVLMVAVSMAVHPVSAQIGSASCAAGTAVEDAANNPGLVSDCDALLAARDKLVGGDGLNWSSDTPIDEWDGVELSAGDNDSAEAPPRRVVRLDLGAQGLSGEIPWELGGLASLRVLELRDNRFSGPVPSWIANFTSMQILDLRGNRLTGTVRTG